VVRNGNQKKKKISPATTTLSDIETIYVRTRVCFYGYPKPIHPFSWEHCHYVKYTSRYQWHRRGVSDLRIFPIRRLESEKKTVYACAREFAKRAQAGLGTRRLFILLANVYTLSVKRSEREKKTPKRITLSYIFTRSQTLDKRETFNSSESRL
jgi:hypothetical protein